MPGSDETVVALWSDVINVYKNENESLMKESKLDYATVYPTNFDKQKVQLIMNVNEDCSSIKDTRIYQYSPFCQTYYTTY